MLNWRTLTDVDLLAGLGALAYGALERAQVLKLGLAAPELALGFGFAALGRWYARARKARQERDKLLDLSAGPVTPVTDDLKTPVED